MHSSAPLIFLFVLSGWIQFWNSLWMHTNHLLPPWETPNTSSREAPTNAFNPAQQRGHNLSDTTTLGFWESKWACSISWDCQQQICCSSKPHSALCRSLTLVFRLFFSVSSSFLLPSLFPLLTQHEHLTFQFPTANLSQPLQSSPSPTWPTSWLAEVYLETEKVLECLEHSSKLMEVTSIGNNDARSILISL